MISLFFSYSHKDEELRDQLEVHLATLKREGAIDVWHDRRIPAGNEVDHTISDALERADVVLLLVSPDFLASPYCNDVEVARAMQRHDKRESRVIPVILRPCDWQRSSFGKLLATPKDGKPVTRWADRDEAFLDIVKAIRQALPPHKGSDVSKVLSAHDVKAGTKTEAAKPRSSNLRLKKQFSEADQDKYREDAFEFIARFFENSLIELQQRNPGIEQSFRRRGGDVFTAVVYRNGKAEARCTIRLGGERGMMSGIRFSHGDDGAGNSFNEILSVGVGEQELFLQPLMGRFGGEKTAHLSEEGAAEYFWTIFIEPLQR